MQTRVVADFAVKSRVGRSRNRHYCTGSLFNMVWFACNAAQIQLHAEVIIQYYLTPKTKHAETHHVDNSIRNWENSRENGAILVGSSCNECVGFWLGKRCRRSCVNKSVHLD